MIYLDASFVLSYLFKESEYEFAKSILESDEDLWSSDLLRFEGIVSFWKKFPKGEKEKLRILESLWSKIHIVKINDSILGILNQSSKFSALRTLDSIHLASYYWIAKESETPGLILASFDERMLVVAKSLKIPILNKDTKTHLRKPKKK